MSKKTDEAPDRGKEFRIRPNRPRTGGKSEARAWSTALNAVLRYNSTSRRSKATATGASGGGSRRRFNQRCAVRTMYAANKTPGQWKAHGRYIARESAGGTAQGQVMADGASRESAPVEPAAELERWQREGDPRMWKLIVSPEFGERVDLDRLTRDLMRRMEKDLRTRLEWVAVNHFNSTLSILMCMLLCAASGTMSPLWICPANTFGTVSGPSQRICVPGNWDIVTTWTLWLRSAARFRGVGLLRLTGRSVGRTRLRLRTRLQRVGLTSRLSEL